VKDKLDADKSISARLAESNRFILATAYLEKQMAAIPKPNEAEVKAYFDQHPERYAERKQYDLQDLRIQTGPDNAAQIKEKLGNGKNVKAFVRWLNEKKIVNSGQQLVATGDQMSEEILQKLQSVKPGEAIAIDGKDQLDVILVNAVQPQPVTLVQATPTIEKMLDAKHKQEVMSDMMKQLREKAKIEYVPPYTANGMTVSGSE
jgi:peptidyl-prolyl cis-trans isomerase C